MDTILRRRISHIPTRLTYWYDPKTCQIILPDKTVHKTSESLRLVPLMNFIERHTRTNYEGTNEVNLYVSAGSHRIYKPDPYWFVIRDGWQKLKFWYGKLHGEYERNGFNVWMYGTGIWFGDEQDLIAMYNAYHKLEEGIRRYFRRSEFVLLSTPAVTGMDLLESSLSPHTKYDILPEYLRDLINQNLGQSRNEHFTPKVEVLENGVYAIDGFFMYASCVSNLPTGPYTHDNVNDIELEPTSGGFPYPKYPGFYRVTFTVPEGWNKVGLLKAPPRPERANDESYYPNEPGQTFTNWTSGSELALAKSQGWHFTIHERIIWPETRAKGQQDPLANFRKTLVLMRKDALKMEDTKQGKLLAAAIRNIFLHTIGSFHRVYRYEEITTPRNEYRYTDFSQRADNKSRHMTMDGYKWYRKLELPEYRIKFCHPEWSATVWARARTRITALALQIPYNNIIGIRTDGIWVAITPDFVMPDRVQYKKPYEYRPGEFRVKDHIKKEHIEKPIEWPKTNDEFIDFIQSRNLELEKLGKFVEDDDTFDDQDEEI